MKKIIFNPIAVVLALTVCFCVFKLWNISSQHEDYSQIKNDMHTYSPQLPVSPGVTELRAQAYTSLAGDLQGAAPLCTDAAAPGFAEIETPVIMPPANSFIIDMQTETNPDIIGWINIPETNIDYPIVQAEDNSFYLRRNIYREDATAGSIFMDYRCNSELAHYNTIIYGHNMRNHSMFGDLRLFADPGFFEENQYGTLFTVFGTYTIRFFAYMVVPFDDEQIYTNPSSPEVFHNYIKEQARNYREPENFDGVVTLSTCSKEFENARGVLIAYVCD